MRGKIGSQNYFNRFCFQDKLKDMCDGIDEAVCLIAAVIHDVDHPGKNR